MKTSQVMLGNHNSWRKDFHFPKNHGKPRKIYSLSAQSWKTHVGQLQIPLDLDQLKSSFFRVFKSYLLPPSFPKPTHRIWKSSLVWLCTPKLVFLNYMHNIYVCIDIDLKSASILIWILTHYQTCSIWAHLCSPFLRKRM